MFGTKRNRYVVSVFLGLCVLFGMYAASAGVSSESPSETSVVEAGDRKPWTPANGYRSEGKCYVVIGQGGLSVEQKCSSWGPVPKPVRQCMGATAISAFAAFFGAVPVLPAAGTTAAGCLAGIF